MADLGELRIPVAMRATAEQVIGLTDKVCADLLDEEYAGLARQVIAKVNGLLFDARELPVEIQVEAYLKRIVPYVPDLGRDATAAMTSARS